MNVDWCCRKLLLSTTITSARRTARMVAMRGIHRISGDGRDHARRTVVQVLGFFEASLVWPRLHCAVVVF